MIARSRLAAVTTAAALLASSAALAAPPTMDECWPNDDGRAWTYVQHYADFVSPAQVDNRTRLIFAGTTVAPSAIQAQYLHQELAQGLVYAGVANEDIRDPFLRTLWRSRPDLRERLSAALSASVACPTTAPPGSYAIPLDGEFAWKNSGTEIAAWRCNATDLKAWQWLGSDLTTGSTFTIPLVPDLASDVTLKGTVGLAEAASVPAGIFPECVTLNYVIDYGWATCVDESGNPTGSSRSETVGFVRYAPGVGPVESEEEWIPYAEVTGSCGPATIGQPASLATMRLESLPTPARTRSWGQLKTAYR